ncbi:MAG TPA: hypothetical protein VJG32_14505 [Anaerolineae bacterium]|nr:hypothetical protein [Anaerolineae bacterium]
MTTLVELDKRLDAWLRWLRLRRAATWAVHGLVAGFALSLVLLGLLLFRGALLRQEFLLLAATLSVASVALAGIVAYLWPVSRLAAARFFDRRFGLRERISTALELAARDGQLPATELDRRQLEDAIAAARAVAPRNQLPLSLHRRELLAALALIAGMLLLWFRGEPFFQAASQAQAVQQAIAEEIAQIEAMRKAIEADDSLTEEQQRALSAPLEEAARRLQETQALEQATSVLVSAEQQLEALSDPQSRQQTQGLREAGENLRQDAGSPLQPFGESLAEGDYLAAAQALQSLEVSELTPAEAQLLAQELEEAADALEATNSDLAAQLREAAAAVRAGDAQAAQQALQTAAQTLTQTGQQIAQSEAAQQAAAQVGEGQQRVIQAGRGAEGAPGESAQGGQAGAGDQSGQGQTGAEGEGQSDQAGESTGQSTGGAGRGEGGAEGELGAEAGVDPIGQNNGRGDGGERDFEQIYAPDRLGGSAGDDVTLPGSGDPGDEVVGQGDTTPDDASQSRVPYVEVFAAYEQAFRQAIESGRVPVHLRSVIREYFSSLQP